MTTIDRSGNFHTGAGNPGGGQFAGRVNTAPGAALMEPSVAHDGGFVIGGDSLETISAAQARRELPLGQRVQVVYLGGQRRSDDEGTPILRSVAKQTSHDMITSDGIGGRGVHLDWSHKSARRDENGTVIVLGEDGLPIVAYIPLDDDSQAITDPQVCLQVTDDLAEATTTVDPAALERLADHRAAGVQRAVAKNQHATGDTLTLIAQTCDEEYTLERVAEHPNADTNTMDVLASSNHRSVRYRAASSERTDPHTLTALASDGETGVRAAAARNMNTPSEVLDRLADDRNGDVRSSVAANPRTRSDVLDRLSRSDGFSKANVGKNPSTPPETLRRLADDMSTGNQARAMVASNQAAPRDIIARSVADGDDWVREHAAKNPSLTVDEHMSLANDRQARVRRAIASNPTAAAMTTLVQDQDAFVRSSYAKNPGVTAETLSLLARDEFHAVRAAVAGNPLTPAADLGRLAEDDAENVRTIARRTLSDLG
jgi:hypothetical protein